MLNNNSKKTSHILNNGKKGHLPVAGILFAAIASLCAAPQMAQAACKTLYVAPNGLDTNPGTIDKPLLSIHQAGKKLLPCDTLKLLSGTYKQFGVWMVNSGTATAPITITAAEGAKPVLDGTGLGIPRYYPFITLVGNYINLSGMEFMNGNDGIWVKGNNNKVSSMKVHHLMNRGILITGDFNTVENSEVSHAALENVNGLRTDWACGIGSYLSYNTSATVKGMVLRNNTIHDVWGEGLQTFQSDGTIVEGNTSYDNWARNFYITASYNLIFRNNLAYNTPNNYVKKRSEGLTLAEEAPLNRNSEKLVIINNMFHNADINAYSWTINPGTGLKNALIANNTIINGRLMTGPLNQAAIIKNNTIFRNDGGEVSYIKSAFITGKYTSPLQIGQTEKINFSNNLWSVAPASAEAKGANDVISADPKFVMAIKPYLTLTQGAITKNDFAIDPSLSPALSKGATIYSVTDSYLVTSEQGKTTNTGAYPANPPFSYLAVQASVTQTAP